jgi:parallel beta-helix repeat protein
MKKYLSLGIVLVIAVSAAVYLRQISEASSICPARHSYVYRVSGGWERTPLINPYGMCVSNEAIKQNLVEKDTWWTNTTNTLFSALHIEKARAAGNTYYVATNGSDSNPCNPSSPCKTIKYAATRLQPGDMLYVRGGTYPEGQNEQNIDGNAGAPSGTSWNSAIIIKGYPGEKAIISNGWIVGNVSYVIIENVTVEGPSTFHISGDHIRLKGVETTNSTYILGYNHYGELINMNVHDSGDYSDTRCPSLGGNCGHGIYFGGNNVLIEGGRWYHNSYYGIQMRFPPIGGDNNVIRNNLIYDNKASGIVMAHGSGHLVYNNIIYRNQGGGILFNSGNTKIYNNTFANNGGDAVNLNVPSSGIEVRNNIIYNSGGIANVDSGSITSSNNLTTDPGFVNSAGNDFHLTPNSPAINAGTALTEVPNDIEDKSRPAGGPEFAVYRHLRTRNPCIDGTYLPKRLRLHRYMN